MSRRLFAVLVALFTLLLFVSCSEYAKKEESPYSTGHILSPEDVTKIVSELTPEEQEPYPIDAKTVYYWTDGGSKFHIFRDCQSLSRTADENVEHGKHGDIPGDILNEPCSFCLKRAFLSKEEFLAVFSS